MRPDAFNGGVDAVIPVFARIRHGLASAFLPAKPCKNRHLTPIGTRRGTPGLALSGSVAPGDLDLDLDLDLA